MPETVHSTGTAKYLPILNRKLREDALELRALAKEGKDTAARREEMLAEIYNALCILYGQLPGALTLSIPTRKNTTTANGT